MEAEKNKNKGGKKVLYKLMNNAINRKTMKNLRNRIDVRVANSKIDYLKQTSKPSQSLEK